MHWCAVRSSETPHGINSFSARIFNEYNGTDSSLEHFREVLYSVKTPDIKKETNPRIVK